MLWLSFVHLLFLFVLTHALPPQEIVCERPFTLNQTLISLPKFKTDLYAFAVGGDLSSKAMPRTETITLDILTSAMTKQEHLLLFFECYSPRHFRLFILSRQMRDVMMYSTEPLDGGTNMVSLGVLRLVLYQCPAANLGPSGSE